MERKLDVIIPTYKPDKEFLQLIEKLQKQEYPVNRIIIMNTEQKYFERLVYGTDFYEKNPNVLVYHVSKKEFDHGFTRHIGVQKSTAPFFLMMTQDAMPVNGQLTKELMEGVLQENIAVAYARQLPRNDCTEAEKFTRNFNYPNTSRIKTKADLSELGIKTYFCSNVCALYNREVYDSLGGFIHNTIFNEDMIYAAGAVKADWGIAYCAKAQVIHSHNYSGREQFHRNFDLGVSQADHPEIFAEVPSESEGIKMVRMSVEHLKEKGLKRKIPGLIYVSGCKYIGYLLGKNYQKLPRAIVDKCTMNPGYWRHFERKMDVCKIDANKGYGKSSEEMQIRMEKIRNNKSDM